jgi:hypothetical protein
MGEQNKIIGRQVVPFDAAWVGDGVRPVGSITATCRCGHSARLDVLDRLERHGRHAQIDDLMRRMRCDRCGLAGWVRLILEFGER